MFQRDGFDIYSNVKISFTQAILGGEARIPGLNGHIMVKARNSRKTKLMFTSILTPLLVPNPPLQLLLLRVIRTGSDDSCGGGLRTRLHLNSSPLLMPSPSDSSRGAVSPQDTADKQGNPPTKQLWQWRPLCAH